MKKTIKFISLILSIMMSVFGITSVSAAETEYLLGDVNLDSEVTISDSTLIQKYLASLCSLSDIQLKNADTTGDEIVSILDVTLIQKYLADEEDINQGNTEPKPTEPSEDLNYNDKYAEEVVELINVERAKEGLAPLKANADLNEVAKVRAKEISTYFSHTRPDGSSCFTAIEGLDIKWKALGENIAGGIDEPVYVMNAWMNSPGHRGNILNGTFESVGVACYNYDGTYYWVQFFLAEW